jgi:hypothetical protein
MSTLARKLRSRKERAVPVQSTAVTAVSLNSTWSIPPRVSRVAAAVLALFCFLALCPVRCHFASSKFDPAWATALNEIHRRGLAHGRDVTFTYGPLAYLAIPMPIGTNLEQGLTFQFAWWFALGAILVWLVVRKQIPAVNFAVLAILAPAGARAFREPILDGPDVFLSFIAILCTGASLLGSTPLYCAAVLAGTLLLLIKLSSGIAALSVVLLFPLALAATDRHRAVRLLAIGLVSAPLLLAALFLVSGAPLSALPTYIRSGLEISSGYSAAMSLVGVPAPILVAVAMLAGFAALAAVLYFKRDRAYPIAVAAMAPLFLEFKHSFVRQDAGHVELFCIFAPLVLGAVLLFANIRSLRDLRAILALALIAGPWLWFERGHYYHWKPSRSPRASVAYMKQIASFSAFKAMLRAKSDYALIPGRLDTQLLSRIGGRSIAMFPWEQFIAAVNPINFRSFPVLQGYTAYTAYLDGRNARFLEEAARPDLILLQWNYIDDRNPLLDCPQTELAMFRNYEFDGMYGTRMLLRKRALPLSANLRLVKRTSMRIGETFHTGASQSPVVRIHLRYTPVGALKYLFFRVPEIMVVLNGPAGRPTIARLPPGVAAGGIPLTLIPPDFGRARQLFQTGRMDVRYDTIAITGPGISAFEQTALVEVLEVPGIPASTSTPTLADLSGVAPGELFSDFQVQWITGTNVGGLSENDVRAVRSDRGTTTVVGWVRPSNTYNALYAEVEGRLYPCEWGTPRSDVASALKDPEALNSGFTVTLPDDLLGVTTHRIRLIKISADGKQYSAASRMTSFRITR